MNLDERRRLAEQLGWSVEETKSFSLLSLRELARPKTAATLTREIESGAVLVGARESDS